MTDGLFIRQDGEWVAANLVVGPSPTFDPIESIDWDAVYWAESLELSDGDPVGTWSDLSGNGRHLTQATSDLRPLFDADGIGGQPSVNADGTNDHLATTGWSTSSETFTFIIVATLPTTSGRTLLSARLSATTRPSIVNTSGQWMAASGQGNYSLGSGSSPAIVAAVYDTVAARALLNGTATRAVLGEAPLDALRAFSVNGSTGYAGARISFIGVYPGDLLEDASWPDLRAWLEATYGISMTPYTAQVPHQINKLTVGGQEIEILAPYDYDAGDGAPLVIYTHGAGENESATRKLLPGSSVVPALLNAGYLVASSRADGNAWGSASSVASYEALHAYVDANWNVTRTVVLAQSMGGLPALHLAASGSIGALGFYMIYPVCDLDAVWAANYSSHRSQITAAYGITGSTPYTFDEATNGRNPTTDLDPADFSGLRFRWSHGSVDIVVPKVNHTDVMAPIIDSYVVENAVGVTGAWSHGSSNAFSASDVVSFFDRCVP